MTGNLSSDITPEESTPVCPSLVLAVVGILVGVPFLMLTVLGTVLNIASFKSGAHWPLICASLFCTLNGFFTFVCDSGHNLDYTLC